MDDRQRDLFLRQWSRRRRIGPAGAVVRGLLIGAVGGLVFAIVLGLMMGTEGNQSTAAVLAAFQRWLLLLGLSVPAFASLMAGVAWRVFASHEHRYQALLQGGAGVPEQAPVMQPGDRWPTIVVGVSVVILFGLVLALWIALG
jgi:hypothetical protein